MAFGKKKRQTATDVLLDHITKDAYPQQYSSHSFGSAADWGSHVFLSDSEGRVERMPTPEPEDCPNQHFHEDGSPCTSDRETMKLLDEIVGEEKPVETKSSLALEQEKRVALLNSIMATTFAHYPQKDKP